MSINYIFKFHEHAFIVNSMPKITIGRAVLHTTHNVFVHSIENVVWRSRTYEKIYIYARMIEILIDSVDWNLHLCFFKSTWHTKNAMIHNWHTHTPNISIKCVNIDEISSKHSHFVRVCCFLSLFRLHISRSETRLVRLYDGLCMYCYEEPWRIIDRVGIYK